MKMPQIVRIKICFLCLCPFVACAEQI